MCSNGTSSPHTEHTRLYLMRPPSLSWSWLNRRLFSSVAGKTLIGIETRPNEMAPFHIVLGMGEASFERPLGAESRLYWSKPSLPARSYPRRAATHPCVAAAKGVNYTPG